MELATGSAPEGRSAVATLLPFGRAVAMVMLVSGINGFVSELTPRYDPAYLSLAVIAMIAWLEPLVPALLASISIAAVHSWLLAPSAEGFSYPILGLSLATTLVLEGVSRIHHARRMRRAADNRGVIDQAVAAEPAPAPPEVQQAAQESEHPPAGQPAAGEVPAGADDRTWIEERRQLEHQLERAMASIARLSDELTASQRELSQQKSVEEGLRGDAASTEQQLRAEIDRVKAERADAERVSAEHLKELGESAERFREESATALDRAEQRRRAIAAEAERLRDDTVRLRDDAGKLKDALARGEEAAAERIASAEAEAAGQRETGARLSAAVDRRAAEEQRLNQEIADLSAAIERSRSDFAAAERALADQRAQAAAVATDRESALSRQVAELSAALEQMRDEVATALSAAAERESALEGKVAELSGALEQSRRDAAAAAAAASDRAAQLSGEVADLGRALQQARDQASAAERALDESRSSAAVTASEREGQLAHELEVLRIESETLRREAEGRRADLERERAQAAEQIRVATEERSLREERESSWTAKMEALLLESRRESEMYEEKLRITSERADQAEQQRQRASDEAAAARAAGEERERQVLEAEAEGSRKLSALQNESAAAAAGYKRASEALHQEARQARALAESLTNEIRLLAQTLSEQKREADTALAQRAGLEKRLHELTIELSDAKSAAADMHAERQQQAAERATLQEARDRAQEELASAREAFAEFVEWRRRFEEMVANERASFEQALHRASQEVLSSNEAVEQMKRLEAQLTDDLSVASRQTEELRVRIATLEQEHAMRGRRLQKEQEEQRAAHAAEIEQWKKKLVALRVLSDKEISGLKVRVAELERDVADRARSEHEERERRAAEEMERLRAERLRRAQHESEAESQARADILQFAEDARHILFGNMAAAQTEPANGSAVATAQALEPEPGSRFSYRFLCQGCGTEQEASQLAWCDCLTPVPTLRCSSCGRCFCDAGREVNELFWDAAPPELLRRRATTVLDREGADQGLDPSLPLVLYVDGDPALRSASRSTFGKLGCSVMTAADGLEGLRLAVKHKPRIVVTDTDVSRIDGSELCRLIKTTNETLDSAVVLVGSGSEPPPAGSGPNQVSPDEFLRKPVQFEVLRATVARLIGS